MIIFSVVELMDEQKCYDFLIEILGTGSVQLSRNLLIKQLKSEYLAISESSRSAPMKALFPRCLKQRQGLTCWVVKCLRIKLWTIHRMSNVLCNAVFFLA
jgi:hypothetical protein